ncbi:MAG: nitrile hydratase subunit beta [Chloroflexi bacterium]|nr:nitrile hydratase subunit beta [Chloroflexota bacterium]|tara:strand:+ start:958 stop:1623 length:666 start_codon:yes stop_codon:yes gene_type:complete
MNKGHDVGGQQGFGPIPLSCRDDEAVFQAAWEARVFALTTAIDFLGKWNLDESRDAIENQKPEDYFEKSYYENWLFGLEHLLIQKGLITSKELVTGVVSLYPDLRTLISLRADQVKHYVYDNLSAHIDHQSSTRFKVGDIVTVVHITSAGHTRLPKYVQGKRGKVRNYLGIHLLPDQNALGTAVAEHCYGIFFSAAELWGNDSDERVGVNVDLWESYLDFT